MSDSLKPKSTDDAIEGTRIDMGDDLLHTRMIERGAVARSEAAAVIPESTEELLVNAKILMGEGFLEEAKATLRRVLRMDAGQLIAKDRLDEIQRLEIKGLLRPEESPRPSGARAKKKPEEETLESVLASLQHELGPGVETQRQLFPRDSDLETFIAALEAICADASAEDRMDLGIGFLEMELFDVAIHQFKAALRNAENPRKARGLLATALVESGRAFDAMIEIESLVADSETSAEEKIDYGYLAGRAQEMLGHEAMAVHWYRAVVGIDPDYRDANERLVLNLKKCAKTPS